MIKKIRKTNEAKREKLEVFTVELSLIGRDSDYFGSEGGQTFLNEEKSNRVRY